jgi:predicted nucleic acid-binding Zn ribbon protein
MSSRRAPRPLAAALAPLTARLEPRSTLAAVQRCWPQVVGAAIAAAAQPVAERDGVLQVACEDGVWAHELELMGPSLVASLNAAIGAPALASVRLRADASRHAPRNAPRAPRSP